MCHVSDGLYSYTCATLESAQLKQEMEGDPLLVYLANLVIKNLYKSNHVGDFSLLLGPRHSTDRREV